MKRIALLSILPEWAEAILEGTKRWEYRRVAPRVHKGSKVLLYATGSVDAIVGDFTVGRTLERDIPGLIRETIEETPHGPDGIQSYFAGVDRGTGMEIQNPVRFVEPITSSQLRELYHSFRPPQNFMYLRPHHSWVRHLIRKLPNADEYPTQKSLLEF